MKVIINHKNPTYLWMLISGIFFLALAQDYLHALLRDYHFYLSEALLFGTFWLLFLPALWIRRTWLKPLVISLPSALNPVLVAVLLTTFHLMLYASILFVVSYLLLTQTYSFIWSMRYAVSDTLYFALAGYGLVELVAWSSKEVAEPVPSPSAKLEYPDRIAVNSKHGTLYLENREIVLLRSASPYVELLTDGRKYLEATTLKALSEVLDPQLFVRIHKSCIVNIACVREQKSRGNGDYDLELNDGTEVRLSRNYAAEFKRSMQTHQLGLN